MAVRFVSTSTPYTATTGLPGTANYTVTCWARWSATGQWQCVFEYANQTGGSSSVYHDLTTTEATGLAVRLYSNGQAAIGSLAAVVDTWYRLAVVVSGTTGTLYWGTADGSLSSASGTVSSMTYVKLWLGEDSWADTFNGRVAAFKHWSVALTQVEVEAELAQYLPRRTTNLLRQHPFLAPEVTDYSGNSNTLTDSTGVTTEDGPPIPWSGVRRRLILPAATAGAAPATPVYQVSQYGAFH